ACTHLTFFFSTLPHPPRSTLFPYTTLFRSQRSGILYRQPHAAVRHGTTKIALLVSAVDSVTGLGKKDRVWHRRVVVYDLFYPDRSEEHTSELQSLTNLVCRLLLEKKKYTNI